MPETRSNTDAINNLTQAIADLSPRTQALEEHRVAESVRRDAESARRDAQFEHLVSLLDNTNRCQGKEMLVQGDSATAAGALPCPTPPVLPQPRTITTADQGQQSTWPKTVRVDVPIFSGEAVDGWLFQMERYFVHNNVSDDQKMALATFYLGGEALKWFQWLHTTYQIKDWPTFVTDVKNRFGPSIYFRAEVQINKLTQTGTVAAYISAFESLSSQTHALSHENLLH